MSLKQQVISGAKWVTFASFFTQFLQLIGLVFYARMLSPEDFGLFAILMIFVGFFQIFTDMGTKAALIHKKSSSEELYSSVFYFNIFVGIILTLVLFLLSTSISIFFDTPKVNELIKLISINFLISSLVIVQQTIFEKELNFKIITISQTLAAIGGLTIGLCLAVYGMGVYSLIYQALATSSILAILIWWYSSWRPMFYFAWSDIKSIWQYTANLSLFNFINYFTRNTDNLLIGKFLDATALGVYSLAYKIMLYPLRISQILTRILFPAFSKIQDDNEKFQQVYLRAIFVIALFTFPLMSGLFVTADNLVQVLFGDKWKGLEVILMILAPVGMLRSITTTGGSIFMAKGTTDQLLKIGIISTVVTVLFFAVGILFGIKGVAFSFLLSNIVLLYPILKMSWGQIELSVARGISEVLPVLFISLIMVLGVFFIGKVYDTMLDNAPLRLIVMIIGGAAIYFTLITLKYGSIKTILKELKK